MLFIPRVLLNAWYFQPRPRRVKVSREKHHRYTRGREKDKPHARTGAWRRGCGISIFTILKCSQLIEKVTYLNYHIKLTVDLITDAMTAHVLLKDIFHVETKVICRTNFKFGLFPLMFSVYTLCVLSFETYMGFVHPLRHRTQVTKNEL